MKVPHASLGGQKWSLINICTVLYYLPEALFFQILGVEAPLQFNDPWADGPILDPSYTAEDSGREHCVGQMYEQTYPTASQGTAGGTCCLH